MIGVRDGDPSVEFFDLARHEKSCARRHLRFPGKPKKHQLGGAGLVLDHDAPGLAGIGRAFVADDLHRHRRHGPWLRLGDFRSVAPVEVRIGHVEKHFDDPSAPGGARQQARHRGAYAAKGGLGCEKRGEGIDIHGLTDVVWRVYDTQPMTEPEHDPRRRRLLFRATHRGTFENDLMVGGFVRAGLGTFSDAELDALEAILELPDVDLADWLTRRREIPPEDATPMLLRIRDSLHQ